MPIFCIGTTTGPRHSHFTLNNKEAIQPIQYDPAELKQISQVVQHDNRLKVLPFNAIELFNSSDLILRKSIGGLGTNYHSPTWDQ